MTIYQLMQIIEVEEMSCLSKNINNKPIKNILLVSACALIDADGRVLMCKRPEGKEYAGKWEFPGGKIEKGETPETALVRELKEELNISTKNSCLAPIAFASHSYKEFHLLMPLFVCRVWTGRIIAKENQEIKWVFPNDIFNLDILEADIPLVSILRDSF